MHDLSLRILNDEPGTAVVIELRRRRTILTERGSFVIVRSRTVDRFSGKIGFIEWDETFGQLEHRSMTTSSSSWKETSCWNVKSNNCSTMTTPLAERLTRNVFGFRASVEGDWLNMLLRFRWRLGASATRNDEYLHRYTLTQCTEKTLDLLFFVDAASLLSVPSQTFEGQWNRNW